MNTARLMVGAGPAPMLQAAAGWGALAAALEAQADELAMQLTALAAAWTGAAGEQAIAATTPMVAWLRGAAAHAQRLAQQATSQAASYTKALATTPSLPEIAVNHVTRAVLVSTNFLGINTMPIGLKEADYFVRMWNQAAVAMDVYQAETTVNTMFEPLPPRKPVLMPGVGEVVEAATMAKTAQMAVQTAASDTIADVTARAAASSMLATTSAEVPSSLTDAATSAQLMNFMSQTGQMATPLLQQLSSLLQQSGSFSGGGNLGGADRPQLGLVGAGPLSNHPLTGGTGAAKGAGLLRGGELPGVGGELTRTPLLANMVDKFAPAVVPAAAGTVNASAGLVGSATGASGSGIGGGAPMGLANQSSASSGSRPGLAMPAMLVDESGDSEERRDDDPYEDW